MRDLRLLLSFNVQLQDLNAHFSVYIYHGTKGSMRNLRIFDQNNALFSVFMRKLRTPNIITAVS